jgi:hypothetical protein
MSAVAPTRNLQVFASLSQLVIGMHRQRDTTRPNLDRLYTILCQHRKRRPLGGASFRAPVRECVQDQLDTIGDAQLVVDPQQRLFHRVLFDAELLRNLAVADAFCD